MKIYINQAEKIKEYFEKTVIPALKAQKRDFSYKETVKYVAATTGSTEPAVEKVIAQLQTMGVIEEVRVLTIPTKELKNFMTEQREKEKELEKIDKEIEFLETNTKPHASAEDIKKVELSTPSGKESA